MQLAQTAWIFWRKRKGSAGALQRDGAPDGRIDLQLKLDLEAVDMLTLLLALLIIWRAGGSPPRNVIKVDDWRQERSA